MLVLVLLKTLDYHGCLDLPSNPTREKNEELFDTLSYFHHPVAVRAVAGQKLLSDDPSDTSNIPWPKTLSTSIQCVYVCNIQKKESQNNYACITWSPCSPLSPICLLLHPARFNEHHFCQRGKEGERASSCEWDSICLIFVPTCVRLGRGLLYPK